MTAELVGDLAVLYVELAAAPRPYLSWGDRPNTHTRFRAWCDFGDRLFRIAVQAGTAVAHAPEPPRAALAVLADAVRDDNAALLDELQEALDDGFSYAGYELGYFYGGQSWSDLCWFRSALTFLAELSGARLLDTDIEDNMRRYGIELYEELDIPPGMPRSHWWWFGEGVA